MPLPLRPGSSASGDLSSPFEETLDSFPAEQRPVTAASADSEFSNALDSFDAEFPDSDDHLDEYHLEHLAAASRPSAEWLTPAALPPPPVVAEPPPVVAKPPPVVAEPPPVVADPIEEISVDEMAISEALDSFYAEAKPPRAAREAVPSAVSPYASVPQRRPQLSGSAMIAFAAVGGSLAAAVVIAVLLLSRAESDSPAVDPSTSTTAQVDAAAAVEPQPGPVPGSASSGVAATPPASQPAIPAAPPSGGAAGRPVVPAEPAVDTPRQPPASRQVPAPLPAPPRSPAPAAAAPTGSGGRDAEALAPRPAQPAPSRAAVVPPAPDEPAVVPTPPRPEPTASSPANAAAAVTPPARDPEPAPAVTPEPPAANDNAVVPPASPPAASAAPATIAPPAPAAAASAIAAEESAVRTVLNRYRSAYIGLDAGAAKAIWPSVDVKALGRAFDRLESQEVDFGGCQVSITGTRATAACNGNARFVPKVGNKAGRREPRHWTFEMRKANQEWTIDNVKVQ